jgi:hypothetical protein
MFALFQQEFVQKRHSRTSSRCLCIVFVHLIVTPRSHTRTENEFLLPNIISRQRRGTDAIFAPLLCRNI